MPQFNKCDSGSSISTRLDNPALDLHRREKFFSTSPFSASPFSRKSLQIAGRSALDFEHPLGRFVLHVCTSKGIKTILNKKLWVPSNVPTAFATGG